MSNHPNPIQDTGGNYSFSSNSNVITDKSLYYTYWNDITSKPSFCNICFSPSFNNIINQPNLNVYSTSSNLYYSSNSFNNSYSNLDYNTSNNLINFTNYKLDNLKSSLWTTDANLNIYSNLGSVGIGSSSFGTDKLVIGGLTNADDYKSKGTIFSNLLITSNVLDNKSNNLYNSVSNLNYNSSFNQVVSSQFTTDANSNIYIIPYSNINFDYNLITSNYNSLVLKNNALLTFNYTNQTNINAGTYNINFNNGAIAIGNTPYVRPWGAYFADDWSGTTLLDSSGNGRHATTAGTITKTTGSGNGATGAITYISGGTSATITWPSGSIPSTFTILCLTRYNGGTRRRIFDASTDNWLHGHWNGNRGVCYYGGGITPPTSIGNIDDWLCCIGKNSGTTPNNILVDGTGRGTTTGGTGNLILTINNGANKLSETSDWCLSAVIIYDSALSDAHMSNLNTLINTYKTDGNISNLEANILKNIDNSYPILKNTSGNTIEPSAWYIFDDNTNIGYDSTNIYNFYNNNAVSTTTGIKGSLCAVFNGTSQYLSGTGVNINSISFSISCWLYPTTLDTSNRYVYAWNGTITSGSANRGKYLHFGYRNSTTFTFDLYYETLDIATTTIDLNTWTYWTATYDHSTKTQTLYKNGVSQGSRITTNLNGIIATTQNYNIGRGYNSSSYFAGRIDDFRIYSNVVLTSEQILELYNGRVSILSPSNLIYSININSNYNSLVLSNKSILTFNGSSKLININAGTYNISFNNGGISINTTPTINEYSYPIVKNTLNYIISPIAFYKFDDNTNLGKDAMYLYNLNNYNCSTSFLNIVRGSGSCSFNGSSSYLTNSTFSTNLSSRSFSILYFQYAYSTTNGSTGQIGGTSLYTGYWFGYGINNSGKYGFGTWGNDMYSTNTYTDTSTWVHVCFTYNSYTQSRKIYRNGVLIQSGTVSASSITNNNFYIGTLDPATYRYMMYGIIDDFRIYTLELSSNQINEICYGSVNILSQSDLINSNIITSTYNSLVLSNNALLTFNYINISNINAGTYNFTFSNGSISINSTPSIIDKSYPIIKDNFDNIINPNVWYKFDDSNNLGFDSMGDANMINNSVQTATTSIKGNYAISTNGTSSYLSTINGYNLNNKNFTLTMWIKLKTSVSAGATKYIYAYNGGASETTAFSVSFRESNVIRCSFSSTYLDTTSSIATVGNWIFLCWVFNNTTRLTTVYLNGILANSSTFTASLNSSVATYYAFGRRYLSATSVYGDVEVDDFRIYGNLNLTSNQILELYNGRVSILLSSNIINSNVGIGTSSSLSSDNLTINGNLNINELNIKNTNISNIFITSNVIDNTSNNVIDNAKSNASYFSSSTWTTNDLNSSIYFNLQGNVGIGSAIPKEKLDINGNFNINGNIIPNTCNTFDLGSSNFKWKDLYLSGNSIYLNDLVISNSNNYLSVSNLDVQQITLNNSQISKTISLDIDGNFKTDDKYLLTINNSLDNSNIVLSNVLSNSSNNIFNFNKSKINSLNVDNINPDKIKSGTSNKLIINDTYSNNTLFTGTIQSYNISTSNLEVIGDTTTFNTTIYQTEQLLIENSCNMSAFIVKQMNINQNVAEFYNSNDNQLRFLINSNGNIGIGSKIPSVKLDVNGNINSLGLVFNNNEIINQIKSYDSNYSNSINQNLPINFSNTLIQNSSNSFYNIDNSKQDLLNSSTILLGTGGSLTNINYNNLINNPDLSIYSTSVNSTSNNLYQDLSNIDLSSSNSGISYVNNSIDGLTKFLWITNGNNVYTNSNVGIGTTLPSEKIDINGNINTNELLIKKSNMSNLIITSNVFNFRSNNYYSSFSNQDIKSSNTNIIYVNNIVDTAVNNYLASLNVKDVWSNNVITNYSLTSTITSTSNSLVLSQNSLLIFNYTNQSNINAGTYNVVFSNGSITFGALTADKSYPILKDYYNSNNTINPIVWYKFDTNSNNMILEASLNTNSNLVLNNNPTFDNINYVKGDGSIYFNNYSTSSPQIYATIPTSVLPASYLNSLNLTNGLSFAFWIYLNSSSIDYGRILYFGNFQSSSPYYDNTNYRLQIRTSSPKTSGIYFDIVKDGLYTFQYSSNVYDNSWKYIVWTISSSGYWNIYINNTLVCNNQSKYVFPLLSSTNLIYLLGTDKNPTNYGIVGNFDDFRIYNKVLTQTEVSELYNGRVNIYSSNISSNIYVNSNTSLLDYSSNFTNLNANNVSANNFSSNLVVRGDMNITGNLKMNNVPISFSRINNLNISITGTGNSINIPTDNSNYRYALFNSNGTFTANQDIICDILIVGGGGGGGGVQNWSRGAGGGGAGEYKLLTSFIIQSGTYSITVGNAGSNGLSSSTDGGNGGSSSIIINGITYLALGGGGGARGQSGAIFNGLNGASGGGGVAQGIGGLANINGITGYNGGNGHDSSTWVAGGGGGFTSAGSNGSSSGGGNGGNGIIMTITGTSIQVCGGGGGGGYTETGYNRAGGAGVFGGGNGGGYGNFTTNLAYDGNNAISYGSGGGGATIGNNGSGGKNGGTGGSGVVIIRYNINQQSVIYNGLINYYNVNDRPYLFDLLMSSNMITVGTRNDLNFPLSLTSWKNEWFLFIGTSPTNVQNSFIFHHITSTINSKWWFNGTTTNTNAEISDERVKKDVNDLSNGLNKLMLLKPKEYFLCDEKDYLKKYGIIAQDVYQTPELNHLVYKDTDFIANIYSSASYSNSNGIFILTSQKIINQLININDELKILLDNNQKEYQEIIIEELPYHNRYKKRFVKVKKIIDDYSFEIYQDIELTEEEKSNIFIYGKKIEDFLKLDYSSLYTLNIKANQEIYDIIKNTYQTLDDITSRVKNLEDKYL